MTIINSSDESSAAMDRLDAAHALLGVSPKTVTDHLALLPQKHAHHANSSSLGGLDALAALATKSMEAQQVVVASHSVSSSSDDDSEAMPPPPPRRQRSCSNPEGMEKWDSLSNASRIRFVLPTSILEEELAEAKCAIERKEEQDRLTSSLLSNRRVGSKNKARITFAIPPVKESTHEPAEPDELLRRARSRLLEDLSEGSISGEKGQLTLPHSLNKYKHVYNKNGRIGIYTPAERAAIIARYQGKRSRRVWNKKIRYNCRKNLADRRLRVKGRFVKRADIPALAAMKPMKVHTDTNDVEDDDMPDVNDPDAGFAPTEDQPYRRVRRHTIT